MLVSFRSCGPKDHAALLKLVIAYNQFEKIRVHRQSLSQGLDVLLVVVVPDFVAFELAVGPTNAAAVIVLSIDLPAQFVPLRAGKRLSHVAVPARLRDEFDG